MHYLIIPFTFLLILGCTNTELSLPNTPEAELATFQLDNQLTIELVASEPIVQDPVAMSFDEDGRLWVVEMRSFMPDIEGNREDQPLSRVKVLIDSDQDGKMDTHHIFLDSLILPRAIACTHGGILIAEQKPLWFAKDTNGDFRADVKMLVDSAFGGSGLIEHSPNGLWRGMDNWFYNAKADFRYKFQHGEWIKEKTEFRGQWGISHDDVGRLYYNYNWSQLHADLVPPNYLYQNPNHTPTSGIDHGLTLNRAVYPIRSNTAVNRGYVPGTLDEEGKLLEFASACSPFVFRGNTMSEEFYGNAFVCEPTANLIKRNILYESGWFIEASEAYDQKEFLASTDERFRPVFLASGPDGALYMADMYRGIVQHGPYMTPYLKEITLKRGLDQHINLGRIWRIKDKKTPTKPVFQLSEISNQELADLLSHSNGWTRDVAQRLLIERNDPTIIPLLEDILKTSSNSLARLHTLWTLEGLSSQQPNIYFNALDDEDPFVQCAAIRILEPLAVGNESLNQRFWTKLQSLNTTAHPQVRMQIALSARILPSKESFGLLKEFLTDFGASPIAKDVVMSSLTGREYEMLNNILGNPVWKKETPDNAIFIEMLARAIASKGNSSEIDGLRDKLIESANWQINALANGMLEYNQTSNTPTHNANEHQADPKTMALGRQQYLTVCASCHGSDGKGLRRFAPPLANSEWVSGKEKQLILLLLQGMQGPVGVNGKTYDVPDILPQMPAFSTMDNGDLAAVMTYIRQAWGNDAPPINPGRVGHIRYRSQGKITPWTAEELQAVSDEEVE